MLARNALLFALRRSLLLPCRLRHGRSVRIEGCFAPGKVNVSAAAGLEVVCNKLRCPETGCAAGKTKCSRRIRICTTGMMRLYTVATSVVRPELLQSCDGETIRLRDLRLRADAVSCQPSRRPTSHCRIDEQVPRSATWDRPLMHNIALSPAAPHDRYVQCLVPWPQELLLGVRFATRRCGYLVHAGASIDKQHGCSAKLDETRYRGVWISCY